MIDIYTSLYTELRESLKEKDEKINVTGVPAPSTTVFPTVAISEQSNITYRPTIDSSGKENHATIMWQIEVLSNMGSSSGRTECREIMDFIDEILIAKNFVRSMCETFDVSPTVIRMVARYTAVVSRKGVLSNG